MKKENKPAIRFKGFTDDWEQRKLGEIADIVGGGTPSTSIFEYWNGNIAWYSPTEIGTKIYADASAKTITQLGYEKSSAKLLPKDKTILFTSRAGIGDMAILRHVATTNQGFQSIVVNSDNNNEFIYYLLLTLKKDFLRKSSGSTFAEISGTQIKKQKILRSHKDEQKKIADFVSSLDAKDAPTQQQLDLA